jgi:small subunit ribosomal protein S17
VTHMLPSERPQLHLPLTTVMLSFKAHSWVSAQKTEPIENTGRPDTMRDIGIDVKNPAGEWDGDANCPFYGSLRLRGQVLEGTVSNVGMQKTITIKRHNVRYMDKYERYEKRTSSVSAHLPACIGEINIGDSVKIMECRPLSKTISFCVVENSGGEV